MRGEVEELTLGLLEGREALGHTGAVERCGDVRRIATQTDELVGAEKRRVGPGDDHHGSRAAVERQGQDDGVLPAGAGRRPETRPTPWGEGGGPPGRRSRPRAGSGRWPRSRRRPPAAGRAGPPAGFGTPSRNE